MTQNQPDPRIKKTHIQRYMKGWWVVVMLPESPSSDLNLKEKGMKRIVHVIIK